MRSQYWFFFVLLPQSTLTFHVSVEILIISFARNILAITLPDEFPCRETYGTFHKNKIKCVNKTVSFEYIFQLSSYFVSTFATRGVECKAWQGKQFNFHFRRQSGRNTKNQNRFSSFLVLLQEFLGKDFVEIYSHCRSDSNHLRMKRISPDIRKMIFSTVHWKLFSWKLKALVRAAG